MSTYFTVRRLAHLLLIIAFTFSSLTVATQPQVWYVKATQQDNCPSTRFSRCHTLMDYIIEYDVPGAQVKHWLLLRTSNIVFHFLPGSHVLDVDGLVGVVSGSNITLTGTETQFFMSSLNTQENREVNNKTTIYCTNSSGLVFTDITSLVVANLSFVGCGAHYSDEVTIGLVFNNVTNLTILGVVVRNSTGYGALIENAFGISQISHSHFVNNGEKNSSVSASILIGWRLQESKECLDDGNNENLVFTIQYSEFLEAHEIGLGLSLRHSCIELFIKLKYVRISGNGNNLLVLIEELEPENASHHVTLHHCQILNGNAINGGGAGFGFRSYRWPMVPNSVPCKNNTPYRSTNSLKISNTVISGNVGHHTGSVGGFAVIQTTCQSYRIELSNVTLSNNTAVTDSGDYGFVGNMLLYSQTLTSVHAPHHSTVIRHSTFSFGMGITGGLVIGVSPQSYTNQIPTVEVYNTTFLGNKGTLVGGVQIFPEVSILQSDRFPVDVHFYKCVFSENVAIFAAALAGIGFTTRSVAAQVLRPEPVYTRILITESVFHRNVLVSPSTFRASTKNEFHVSDEYTINLSYFIDELISSLKIGDSPFAAVVAYGHLSITFRNTEFSDNDALF